MSPAAIDACATLVAIVFALALVSAALMAALARIENESR